MAAFDKLKMFTRRAKVHAAYQDVFNSDAGRTVLKDLIMRHRVMETPYLIGGTPQDIGFECGRQHVVKEIMKVLRVDAQTFSELMEEADEYQSEEF